MLKPRPMLLVCALAAAAAAAAQLHREPQGKSLGILKEELQKNNDDYKDRPTNELSGSDKLEQPPGRRALDGGAGPASASAAAAAPAPAPTPARPRRHSSARSPAPVARTPAQHRGKVDKLRSFLDKYKVIVNEFMANHSERRQVSAVPAAAPAPPAAGPALAPEPQQWDSESGEPVLRAEELPAGLDHRPPSGAQLDMSPARGGVVHSLRNKNRLCHRHVMIPEGPKYDSNGRVYLAEYTRLSGNDYTNTRAPRLLLPKCCNCCRKSVLGCE